MKTFASNYAILIVFGLILVCVSVKSVSAQNSINGMVFDQNRKPVANIYVELLDEYERLIKSVPTSGSGLYFFQNLRAGIYYIGIRTGGTIFKETHERIQIGEANFTSRTTGQTSGSDVAQKDIYLEVDQQRKNEILNNEVVFAQNIPEQAQKSYESALNKIDKNQAKAIEELKKAIDIFPDYFLALNQLGSLHLAQKMYEDSEAFYQKAVNINSKSYSSLYGLGISQYRLGKKEAALNSMNLAVGINTQGINALFYLGKIQRELKNFTEAEINLKKVNKLSNNKLADAHMELALLYNNHFQRYSEAADELELYLKANPDAENKEQVKKLIKTFRGKAKQSE
jgi:tetratricopeptide (TPR) repeat protein